MTRYTEEWLKNRSGMPKGALLTRKEDFPPKEVIEERLAKAFAPKFKNAKTVANGKTYDSKKEAARANELRMLEKAGKIHSLREQVTYRLEVNGQLVCKYIADFVYCLFVDGGRTVVEDVKSDFTRKNPVYRIKKKLMKACHGIDILET